MARYNKNPKPVVHATKWNRSVQGEYTMVNKRVGVKKFEVPLHEGQHMNTVDLAKLIAVHHNEAEEHILIEPAYYTVDNTGGENPYPNGIDAEDDGWEYNQRGNLVKTKGEEAKKKREQYPNSENMTGKRINAMKEMSMGEALKMKQMANKEKGSGENK